MNNASRQFQRRKTKMSVAITKVYITQGQTNGSFKGKESPDIVLRTYKACFGDRKGAGNSGWRRGTYQNPQLSIGEREKERMKICEEIITENVPNREREWSTKSRKQREFPAG